MTDALGATSLDIFVASTGLIAIVSALLAVATSRVVHSALWLAVCLLAVAGIFLGLGAEIVALVQVLVYVGAVVVLIILALMMTRSPTDAAGASGLSQPVWRRVLAALLGVAVAALLAAALVPLAGSAWTLPAYGRTSAVGAAIFASWVWPFELISLVLLAALVSAIAMVRPRIRRGRRR